MKKFAMSSIKINNFLVTKVKLRNKHKQMETSTFVKQLSSNSRVVREKSLETLKKFIVDDKFKHAKQLQYDKLWKGLYYSMWFSDRPRPQQRLANKLGELYMLYFDEEDNKSHKFENDESKISDNDKAFIKFSKAFWKILCIEWFNIDKFRMDKFLLLTRRVLFNQLRYLQKREWHAVLVEKYIRKVLKSLPLSGDRKVYNGIPIHVIDIILDEWERLYTNVDDEAEDESDASDRDDSNTNDKAEIEEWIKTTPIEQFLEIFNDLYEDRLNSKVIRHKIQDDLFTDSRLVEWGIPTNNKTAYTTGQDAQGDDHLEDHEDHVEEWKGF